MALGVGDVVRCSAIMLDPRSSQVVNAYDVEITTAGTGGDTGFKEDVVEWMNDMYANIASHIDSGAAVYQVGFFQRNVPSVLTPIAWTGTTFTNSAQELPAGTAALIFAHTTVRRTYARKYLGPFTEDGNIDGALTSTLQSALASFASDWYAGFTGSNGWSWDSVVWPSSNTGSIPLIDVQVSGLWAIQKRRRFGRGS